MRRDLIDRRGSLIVEELTVRYGGVVAVADLSLTAPTGAVTGLIGPNGAGKTTTFNACNGLVRPSSGRVRLFDDDITKLSPQARARHGLGRTFQRMELFDALTVAENVALGREARLAGSSLRRQLAAARGEHEEVASATAQALKLCGIEALGDEVAATLPTGHRRLTELARVVAGGFSLLLLDEPSSGLDRDETARFGEIVRTLVDERRTGVLLVEHDVELVLAVSDHVYVLDFGMLIFQGSPAETARSEVVRAAYLGSEAA